MPAARFIVKSLRIEYLKKARGTIEAVCECEPPHGSEKKAYDLEVRLTDASGELVATVHLETLVGPVR